MEQYSVLMSLYDKESPENLRQALDSMLHQTLPPDQIVLVKDGPLTTGLEATLAEYTQARPDLFAIIALAENHGLAYALDKGLRACRNELVARMDTDDISLPERCEAQVGAFREHPEMSIVGGLSYLFVGTPDNIIPKVRKKPLDQEGIKKFIRRRNPLGHPTVMYKKSEVLRCGSYDGSLRGVEDYDLFSRMINSGGCVAMNLPVPVLLFRGREGGMARSKSNADRRIYIAVQRRIWKRGHCSFGDYLYIWCAMTVAQIMPERLYAALQQRFFRTALPGGKGGPGMNPIRVLHVVGGMGRGGMETFIMNLYRNTDRSKVQFDFLVHRQRKGAYEDEIASLGGKVYHLTFRDDLNFIKYRKDLNAFFAGHPEYRVVHGHHSALGRFYLKTAKNGGVPVRIAHAHHAQYNHTLRGSLSHLLELGFPKYATEYFACTQSAGAFLLGKDKRCFVVANGVDPAAYAFSTERRNATRRALGLGNCFAVGHVGRFSREKNHAFLLRVFGELLKLQDDARLLLAGNGPLREAVERQARDMGIADKVMFLGVREDVPDLLQAMDVFLLPSLFEGLPLTLLEAQSAGLPVLCSDVVTRECALSPLYQACSLRTPPREWAKLALAAAAGEEARRENNRYIVESDFNILRVAAQLQEKYLQLANRG